MATVDDDSTPNVSVPLGELQKTRNGVSLVFYGLELFGLVLLAGIALQIAKGRAPNILQYQQIYEKVAPWLYIVAFLMGVVGRVQCLSTPPHVSNNALIIVAVVFDLVVVGWQLATVFSPELIIKLAPNLGALILILFWGVIVTFVLLILATTFFLFFLRQMAFTLGEEKIAGQCMGVVVLQFIVIGLLFGPAFIPGLDPSKTGLIVLAAALLWLIWLARYSRVLYNVKDALAVEG